LFRDAPVFKKWLALRFVTGGEERPDSDVDILVTLDYSQSIGLRFFGMYEDLKDLLGRNVDLVSDRTLAPFARESADHDKKLIYERTA